MIVILGADDLADFFDQVKDEVKKVGALVMSAKDDVQAVVNQLDKAAGEILTKIDELDTKIAEGTVTAEDLAPLKAAAQKLDDIVADAPVDPEPEPETPAEPSNPGQL